MSKILIKLINFYQCHFSLDHSPRGRERYPYGYCRFSPSCSEYARQTIENRGMRGIGKIILRIIRCNPFSAPAFDPIIKQGGNGVHPVRSSRIIKETDSL